MPGPKEGKTEKPTGKRLSDAKKKGDHPRSQELSQSVSLFLAILLMAGLMPYYGRSLQGMMRTYFSISGEKHVNADMAVAVLNDAFDFILILLLPVFIILFVAAILVSVVQTRGFQFLMTNLKPKWEKLNFPFEFFKGLKKIFSGVNTYFELLKSIIKVFIIAYIAYLTIKDDIPTLTNLPKLTVLEILQKMGQVFFKLALSIIVFLLALSILDYIWQRYQYIKKLMMSKDDIKEEYKQLEGDPKIKGKRRSLQYQQAFRRMMAEVPQADVVITNPTHLAVALKYEYKKMHSPKVVAKGKNLVAERIKKVAQENRIPVIEDPPLARGIYAAVEINQFIPAEFFKPIAEILAYIYKIKGRRIG